MAIFMALEGHRRGDFQVLAFTLVAGNTKVENQPRNMLRILQLVPEIYGEVSNTDATPFQWSQGIHILPLAVYLANKKKQPDLELKTRL